MGCRAEGGGTGSCRQRARAKRGGGSCIPDYTTPPPVLLWQSDVSYWPLITLCHRVQCAAAQCAGEFGDVQDCVFRCGSGVELTCEMEVFLDWSFVAAAHVRCYSFMGPLQWRTARRLRFCWRRPNARHSICHWSIEIIESARSRGERDGVCGGGAWTDLQESRKGRGMARWN